MDWATVISGGLGMLGQLHANNQNVQNARETNKFNREERLDTQRWNRQQWLDMLAYNTPANQRKRYEEAGINPFLALGNITAGNASGSVTSSPATGNMPSPMQNIATPLQEGIASSVSTYLDKQRLANETRLADEQAKSIKAKTELDLIEAKTKHRSNEALIERIKAETDNMIFNLDYLRQRSPLELENLRAQIESATSITERNKLETALAKFDLENVRPLVAKQMKASIAREYATVSYLYSQGKVNEEQIKTLIAERALTDAKKAGVDIDNQVAKDTAELVVKTMEEDLKGKKAQRALVSKYVNAFSNSEARAWMSTTGGFIRDVASGIGNMIPFARGTGK